MTNDTDPFIYEELNKLRREINELKGRANTEYGTVFAANEPVDHFNRPTLNPAWAWDAINFSGAPDYVSLSDFPSHLVIGENTTDAHFLSRAMEAGESTYIYCGRFFPKPYGECGIRIEDAAGNTALELTCRQYSGKTLLTAQKWLGGVYAWNQFQCNLPIHPITLGVRFDLAVLCWRLYYSLEPHLTTSDWAGLTSTFYMPGPLNPSNWGIVFRGFNSIGSTDYMRRFAIDWVDKIVGNSDPSPIDNWTFNYPVAVQYTKDDNQIIPNTTNTILTWDNLIFQGKTGLVTYNPGVDWYFTCPIDGLYHIDVQILLEAYNGWATSESAHIGLSINGVNIAWISRVDWWPGNGVSIYAKLSGSVTRYCVAGTVIRTSCFQFSGANLVVYSADASHNWLNIERIEE